MPKISIRVVYGNREHTFSNGVTLKWQDSINYPPSYDEAPYEQDEADELARFNQWITQTEEAFILQAENNRLDSEREAEERRLQELAELEEEGGE
jgi:hypothetical protein